MRESESPRIVAIGDSLIYGRLDSLHGGWVGLLREWLEQAGPQMSAVFNLGIGGDTSVTTLKRAAAEIPLREPNLVVIGVGTNDCRRQSPNSPRQVELEEYRSALRALVELSANDGAQVAIAEVPPVDESKTRPHKGRYYYANADAEAYALCAREVADDAGAILISFASVFGARAGAFVLQQPRLLGDGIHPNTAGHEAMFDLAKRELRTALAPWGVEAEANAGLRAG